MSQRCFIGKHLDIECDKLSFAPKQYFIKFNQLEKESQEVILWRCGLMHLSMEDETSICNNHFYLYEKKYSNLKDSCCDPFKEHNSTLKKSKFLPILELQLIYYGIIQTLRNACMAGRCCPG